MKGYSFLRQRPVLNYIADFMCKELKLIIEVDGITHSFEETIKKDEIRQKVLENSGFRVLRFTDEEVLTAINRVRDNIEDYITMLESGKIIPLPPSPAQEPNARENVNNNFCISCFVFCVQCFVFCLS
jgi:very-short-patch-repair endonuclease